MRRQVVIVTAVVACVITAAYAVSRLEPAAPTVSRASVWIDRVREGEMLRQVRGQGKLVPRETRWIAAQAPGRIERILVRPGAVLEPDSVFIEMSNPELEQQTEEARLAAAAAEADYAETELRLKGSSLINAPRSASRKPSTKALGCKLRPSASSRKRGSCRQSSTSARSSRPSN